MSHLANEEKILDALAIRDTSDHNSSVSENRGFVPKTIVIHNSLDEQVSVQLQGDIVEGFSNPMDVGSPFNVATTTNDYATLTDYLPFFRVVCSCGSAPTTGSVTIYLAKVEG